MYGEGGHTGDEMDSLEYQGSEVFLKVSEMPSWFLQTITEVH